MTATIRRARADEAEALAALGAATFTATFGHLYSRSNLEKFLAKNHSPAAYRDVLADARSAVWIAENAGERSVSLHLFKRLSRQRYRSASVRARGVQ